MPKDKERTVNPATAALKASKAKQLKKSKAQIQAQRSERLSQRNPDRLQKQIDELTAEKQTRGGKLRPKDQETLDKLEKDVRLIKKSRDQHGVPDLHRGGGRGGDRRGAGGANANNVPLNESRGFKRRRDGTAGGRHDDDESTTDEEARDIPMPRDTPPPIPPRPRQRTMQPIEQSYVQPLPQKPLVAKTTYSSAPQVRDLRKEAVSKFMPAAVAARIREKAGNKDKLLEPEEMDALEEERQKAEIDTTQPSGGNVSREIDMTAEEEAFERELQEESLREAGEGVVEEAMNEAEHEMMMEETASGLSSHQVEAKLNQVELEEVEDDGD